jgi:signal transduction histidine kinase
MPYDLSQDVAIVAGIPAVPTILDVVCRTTGMGFAAIARVTGDRWIACGVRDQIGFGLLPGSELPVKTTLCDEVRQNGQALVINHVAEDQDFCGHPVPAKYNFQSYISVPIMLRDGSFFGTLCAIDPKPAQIDKPETVAMFRLFSEMIAMHLDAAMQLAESEASLTSERRTAELREQFIAVLGHDLRNPLAAIDGGARLLLRTPLNDKAQQVVGLMQNSVQRMAGMIDNVLDFARGRLGGGITLKRTEDAPLDYLLEQVVAELRTAWPKREIVTSFSLAEPVSCDTGRIGQLFSNLVTNALRYGAEDRPVSIEAISRDGAFELSVRNQGDPIPPNVMERMFQPFSRSTASGGQEGLGLGLYIASEIARAHGGALQVTSTSDETRFTFRMPTAYRAELAQAS